MQWCHFSIGRGELRTKHPLPNLPPNEGLPTFDVLSFVRTEAREGSLIVWAGEATCAGGTLSVHTWLNRPRNETLPLGLAGAAQLLGVGK
jgi:hypothetical protein